MKKINQQAKEIKRLNHCVTVYQRQLGEVRDQTNRLEGEAAAGQLELARLTDGVNGAAKAIGDLLATNRALTFELAKYQKGDAKKADHA